MALFGAAMVPGGRKIKTTLELLPRGLLFSYNELLVIALVLQLHCCRVSFQLPDFDWLISVPM